MTGATGREAGARLGGMRQVTFEYRAVRADGAPESGTVDAESREAARALLTGRGLFPTEVRAGDLATSGRRHLPARDLALGLRVLANLLGAGLPMGKALAAFDDLAPDRWRVELPALREAVRGGQSLGAALAASPLGVPPLVAGVVQAGEAAGDVADAVARAAELTERAVATRSAIRAALTYPAVLACAGAASLALLVGVVLPRFAVILADLGQALPPATRLVLAGAGLMRALALPTVAALAAALLVWQRWTATAGGRERWHTLLLAVPLVGTVRRSAATARVTAALASLLASGVPIAPALSHAAQAAGDAALEARLLAAREGVVTGQRISEAVATADALTPTAVKLVRAGEETGQLARMLDHASALERERAELLVRNAVRLLEPALILAFGGAVAFVAAALLQAVYSVRPAA